MHDSRVIVGAGSGIGRSLLRLSLGCSDESLVLFDKSFDKGFLHEFGAFKSRLSLVEGDVDLETDWNRHFSDVTSVCSFAFLLPQCRSRDTDLAPLGFTKSFSRNVSELNFSLLKCLESLQPKFTGKANLVFVSSVLGTRVALDDASLDYHASKAVLESIMRYMAVRLSPVSVNCVAPGLIARDLNSKLVCDPQIASRVHKSVPLGRACSQDEVAKVCWALCSGAMPYVSGQMIVMDGGSMVLEPFGITGR